MKRGDAKRPPLASSFNKPATLVGMRTGGFAQDLTAQLRRQHHPRHGEPVLTCPVCLPVARSMISTSPPDGVATCSTSLPASVEAETIRAPGARVMAAAAGAAAAGRFAFAAMKIWAWRTKP